MLEALPTPGQRYLGGEVPEGHWDVYDDECDCVFVRIGDWTNPYLGRSHRVRLCCMWAQIAKEFPDFIQDIPAYYDKNTKTYITEPMEWNGEDDMSRAFWYRQLAAQMGISLPEIRERFKDQQPPKGIPRPVEVTPPQQRPPMGAEEIIGRQSIQLEELRAQLDATVGVIHALKKGELDLDRVELKDNGFTVKAEETDGGK